MSSLALTPLFYVETRNTPLCFLAAKVIAQRHDGYVAQTLDGVRTILLKDSQISRRVSLDVARDINDLAIAELNYERWLAHNDRPSPLALSE